MWEECRHECREYESWGCPKGSCRKMFVWGGVTEIFKRGVEGPDCQGREFGLAFLSPRRHAFPTQNPLGCCLLWSLCSLDVEFPLPPPRECLQPASQAYCVNADVEMGPH